MKLRADNIKNIKERFPSVEITHKFDKFGLFDIDQIKQLEKKNILTYENETYKKLHGFYAKLLPPKEIILLERNGFKIIIHREFRPLNYDKTYENFYKMSQFCPSLKLLFEIYDSIPLSSVQCELYFSKLNSKKTEKRNLLLPEALDALMNISINGKPFSAVTKA